MMGAALEPQRPAEIVCEMEALRKASSILYETVLRTKERMESICRQECPATEVGKAPSATVTILGGNIRDIRQSLEATNSILDSVLARLEI